MQRDAPVPHRTGHGPQSITDVGPVAALSKKASKLEALDRALRQTLPSPLREQVRFANFRDDRLVFLASSPAWASRLRLQQAQILAAARAIGANAGSVTVKVAPLPPPDPQPEQSKPLSIAAALHLKAAAKSIPDPELRALFLELASVAKPADSTPDGTP
ncbi:DciA family protein [Dyella flava]|uniref:DUF721 domain-containing protein n=1 Tax=Dyella flava TaxID=1920170 RepID=A0ABS2K2G7_9GAMM|nr:DUF721 domain-containing protein [Dyella flava]MBM7125255.1 DUF721 domain-containing protein [Dyella flava]GLQ50701.1 hypothetical protein GCM10010872_21500 [Dyella flava]